MGQILLLLTYLGLGPLALRASAAAQLNPQGRPCVRAGSGLADGRYPISIAAYVQRTLGLGCWCRKQDARRWTAGAGPVPSRRWLAAACRAFPRCKEVAEGSTGTSWSMAVGSKVNGPDSPSGTCMARGAVFYTVLSSIEVSGGALKMDGVVQYCRCTREQ